MVVSGSGYLHGSSALLGPMIGSRMLVLLRIGTSLGDSMSIDALQAFM